MSTKAVNAKVTRNRARVIFSLIVVAMVVGCVGIVASASAGRSGEAVKASSVGENGCSLVTGRRRCYKSVEIQKGDTLWGLAEKYISEEYDSIPDYIEEIKRVNGMSSDRLYAGGYIVIPYFAD